MNRRSLTTLVASLAAGSLLCAAGAFVVSAYALDAWDMRSGNECANWPGRLKNAEAAIADPEKRFFALADAAKSAFELGDHMKAKLYAQELLTLAPKFSRNWNFGNAIHDSHMVLGRVALASGDVELAKTELLAAGRTPGSPQLDSFGPNMSLARDLLRAGEQDAVLSYFRECSRFWELGERDLRVWAFTAKLHLPPSFGANLIY
jgi:hypothetical protein